MRRVPAVHRRLQHTTDAVALQVRDAGSENIKSSHQFLACFHRLLGIHPAKHFFPTFPIHCCEFAHELVARFPFCVFGRANPKRQKRGDDPDRNVCRSDQEHKNEKPLATTYKHTLALQSSSGLENAARLTRPAALI